MQSTAQVSNTLAGAASLLQGLLADRLAGDALGPLLRRYRLMPQLVQELILDEAIAAIACPEDQVSAVIVGFYARQGITTEDAKQAWLEQQQLSEGHAAELALRAWRIEQFKQATWGRQVESHFLACKSQLDQVVYSVLRVERFPTAQELYFRIKAGEQDFAAAVREYSQGAEAATGGLVGPMPLSQPHPLVANKLRSAQVGQVLPPFQLENWAVLLRLNQVLPAKLDAPTRQKLLDHLFQTWLKATVAKALASQDPKAQATQVQATQVQDPQVQATQGQGPQLQEPQEPQLQEPQASPESGGIDPTRLLKDALKETSHNGPQGLSEAVSPSPIAA
jgi:parvulin-like peptidyl-prolyl isomerase